MLDKNSIYIVDVRCGSQIAAELSDFSVGFLVSGPSQGSGGRQSSASFGHPQKVQWSMN